MAIEIHLAGAAEIPAGSVNLHAYPGLSYAPSQHGEGIRFARNGRPTGELVPLGDVVGPAIDDAAARLGVSFGDVCDGLKYLRDAKAI